MSRIQLPVIYEEQTDNIREPDRTCNTTSNFMVARYLGSKIASDDAFLNVVNKYGDTTDHVAMGKALVDVGIQSKWTQRATFADLDKSLEQGYPVVVGILHRGHPVSPKGGHMIVVIGKDSAKQSYIVHDPYGSLLDPGGGYTGNVLNGKAAEYPIWQFIRRWNVPPQGGVAKPGEGWGWARFFNVPGNKLPAKK